MALTSSEIIIGHFDGWVPLVCTGTILQIAQITGGEILLKFGVNSDVHGIMMKPGDSIKVDETVYVKAVVADESYPILHIIKN